MFIAKVHSICITCASGVMTEKRLAQEALVKWNCLHGEENGVVFLQVPQYLPADVYFFIIDNFVDVVNVESMIALGANVVLFFASYHDPKNTISSEIKAIEELRNRIGPSVVCLDYKCGADFEETFMEYLNSMVAE